MNPETEAFLHGLFGRSGTTGQPTFLTLSAIHPSSNLPTPSRHVPLDDIAALDHALDSLMAANTIGWGAYIGVAPRRANLGRWARGGKGNLAEIPSLFIDVDDPDKTLPKLRSFSLPPSCIVSSGKGIHAYWYLREPTHQYATADLALRGLADYFASDTKMTIAQSMRLVGSVNSKPGRNSTLCRLVDFHPQRLYDLEDFTEFTMLAKEKQYTRYTHLNAREERVSDQRNEAVQAITGVLMRNFGGYLKRNGWIAALCPLGHVHDRPGKHFNWHPKLSIAICFGRHGKLSIAEICHELGFSF